MGEVERDEIVGGEGGSGEGGDDNLDEHDDEQEDADGDLRGEYSRTLFRDTLGAVCIAHALDGVQGEVHHWRD